MTALPVSWDRDGDRLPPRDPTDPGGGRVPEPGGWGGTIVLVLVIVGSVILLLRNL
jgi:hypothetical protein